MDKMTANQVPAVHLYQIAYSPATMAGVEPGYAVMDNLENLRPDWFEYWPIRQYLHGRSFNAWVTWGSAPCRFASGTERTPRSLP